MVDMPVDDPVRIPLSILMTVPMFLRLYLIGRYMVLHSSIIQVSHALEVPDFTLSNLGRFHKSHRVAEPDIRVFPIRPEKSHLRTTPHHCGRRCSEFLDYF